MSIDYITAVFIPHKGGIIVEPPSCDAPESGALIGVGQGTTYLDSNTEAYQICCRVQGPPGYRVTWLLNGNRISSGQRGYEFGEDFMRYSGPLNRGCITYTCEVEFPLGLSKRSEVSELCIGGQSLQLTCIKPFNVIINVCTCIYG